MGTRHAFGVILLVVAAGMPVVAFAGEADVVAGEVVAEGNGAYTFRVAVRHADTGWEHYADRWEVVAPDGRVLATRKLWHPHENEQPFTRSLSGVHLPREIEEVILRAHDSVHGYGGREIRVAVPR